MHCSHQVPCCQLRIAINFAHGNLWQQEHPRARLRKHEKKRRKKKKERNKAEEMRAWVSGTGNELLIFIQLQIKWFEIDRGMTAVIPANWHSRAPKRLIHARVCTCARICRWCGFILRVRERESVYNLSSLSTALRQWNNADDSSAREQRGRLIEPSASDHAVLGTHAHRFHTSGKLFVISATAIWVTGERNFVIVTWLYAQSRSKSVRPSSDLFYWHTISVPFRRRREKSDRKEHKRARANKQRETQSRGLIRSVANALRLRVFLFH